MIRKLPPPWVWLCLAAFVLVPLTYIAIAREAFSATTGMLFLATVCLLGFLFAELSMLGLRPSADTKKTVRLFLTTIGALAFGLEILFRFGLGTHMTYLERIGLSGYRSEYEAVMPSWFHVYGPNTVVDGPRTEFTHSRNANSLGLPEREIPPDKAPDEYRIVALGDSFTEGVGTTYDSSWVRVLERRLTATRPTRPIHAICIAPGFLDSDLNVIISTQPRPGRRSRVALEPGCDSRTSPASTARCTSA